MQVYFNFKKPRTWQSDLKNRKEYFIKKHGSHRSLPMFILGCLKHRFINKDQFMYYFKECDYCIESPIALLKLQRK